MHVRTLQPRRLCMHARRLYSRESWNYIGNLYARCARCARAYVHACARACVCVRVRACALSVCALVCVRLRVHDCVRDRVRRVRVCARVCRMP